MTRRAMARADLGSASMEPYFGALMKCWGSSRQMCPERAGIWGGTKLTPQHGRLELKYLALSQLLLLLLASAEYPRILRTQIKVT